MARPRTAKTPQPAAPEVMTIDDLSSYIQVPKSSIYKLAQDGKIPAQKIGKHWRFHKPVIDEWLRGAKGGS